MNETLKEQLMQDARSKGICVDGYNEMRSDDIDELIGYYIANPNWCMERDYPTLDFLRANFGNLEDKGIYIDKTFKGETLDEHVVYILHNCRGTVKTGLNVEKGIIPMFYLGNRCRVRFVGAGDVKPKRPSEVPICKFGKNEVSAHNNRYVTFDIETNEMV